MEQEVKKSLTQVIFIILFLLAFVIFTPGSAYFWYKRGVGNSYGKYIEAGVSREVARQQAVSRGTLYAVLMVNANHVPLLGLLIATTGIVRRYNSPKAKKYSRIAFLFFCIYGAICLAFAQSMVSRPAQSFLKTLTPASLIWLAIAAILGIVILCIMLTRRILQSPTEPSG